MSDHPTLESLDTRLQRLIEEWRNAYKDTNMMDRHPEIDFELAEFVGAHPELIRSQPTIPELVNAIEQAVPAYYSPDGLVSTLIPQLLALPDEIRRLQEAYNQADYLYQVLLTATSIKALSEPLFPGKDGVLRSASNEVERSLAIARIAHESSTLGETSDTREKALADLQQARNRLECARLIVQLLCKGNGK